MWAQVEASWKRAQGTCLNLGQGESVIVQVLKYYPIITCEIDLTSGQSQSLTGLEEGLGHPFSLLPPSPSPTSPSLSQLL